jgi:hypothetical protein
MIKKISTAFWNFLVAWGEAKYEFHRRQNHKAWY